ncbi:MAG: hypothetical protein JSU75_03995 [Gammaproteobacteria bacterium]|nr:MAG: hypothetical protein JSU75_03995 [Gammaproteobacteria bacterium]
MKTLLILGSKPEPCLPPADSYDAVACANASGYSADKYGLPVPVFTAMTAHLTSGIESGKQSLQAIRGLHTETVYLIPRHEKAGKLRKKIQRLPVAIKTSPLAFKRGLRRAGFGWDTFASHGLDHYFELIRRLCHDDAELMQLITGKKPSTGLMALVIGMSLGAWQRFILSGFSFELTHAYADNPEIRERGTVISGHTDTDLVLLRRLAAVHGNIFTTETTVHEQAGIPLLQAAIEGGPRPDYNSLSNEQLS